jgi:hypothetical protein
MTRKTISAVLTSCAGAWCRSGQDIKDIKVGFANINAKAEGIETKPAFREAFRQRRCLVPVDSFYEWKKTASGKQPYAIGLKCRNDRPCPEADVLRGRRSQQGHCRN